MPSVREIQRQIRVAQLPKTITNADSPYTLLPEDNWLIVDATAGNVTINLPTLAFSDGRELDVKKIDGSANTVILTPNGSDQVENAATLTVTTQYEAVTLRGDKTSADWWVI